MEREEIYQEARELSKRVMSTSEITASRHANTYYRQQKPELSLEEVIEIFRQAFAEKRSEDAEEAEAEE